MSVTGIYIVVGLVCLVIGAALGVLWGRRHPSAAGKVEQIIEEAKSKQ